MKKNAMVIVLIIQFFLPAALYAFHGEFMFVIQDKLGAYYNVRAKKVGINPSFGRYFERVEDSSYICAQTTFVHITDSIPTLYLGFDWIYDDTTYAGNGILYYNNYQIEILRKTSQTDSAVNVVFTFNFDIRNYDMGSNPSTDIFFHISRDSIGHVDAKYEYHKNVDTTIVEIINQGENLKIWEIYELNKKWDSFIQRTLIKNEFDGELNLSVPIILKNAIDAFPYTQKPNGYEYTAGTIDTFWRGGYYSFNVTNNSVLFNGKGYKAYKIGHAYGNSVDSFIVNDSTAIVAKFNQTTTLSVVNNLEGGNGGEYRIKWSKLNDYFAPVPSNGGSLVFPYTLLSDDKYDININSTFDAQNTAWQFLNWNDGVTSTTLLSQQITQPTILTANYKGIQRTNKAEALTNSGQRKVARTADGTLHQVYESMNSIWYETSTDNGSTWELMNGGARLNSQTAKNPAIAYKSIAGTNYIAIIFEEMQNEAGYSKLNLTIFSGSGSNYQYNTSNELDSVALYASGAKPGLTCSDGGRIVVVWEKRDVLPEKYTTGIHAWGRTIGSSPDIPVVNISNTDANSQNATVEIQRSTPTEINYPFHVAWQQSSASDANSAVRYCQLNFQPSSPATFTEQPGSYTVMSSGSGYSKNLYPSIIVYADGEARLSWIGKRNGYYEGVWDSRVIFRGGSNAYFWSFGANADACNINQYPGGYAIAWSQTTADGFSGKLMKNTSFTTYYDLRDEQNAVMTARHLQVNNGADFSSM